MNNSYLTVVSGSIQDTSQRNKISIAESFANAKVVAIVDTSGSMDAHDSRGGKRRYDVACDELALLQQRHPGEIAVLSFSDSAVFCPSGVPDYKGQGTNLTGALIFAKQSDVAGMRFIVISDGLPDDSFGAIEQAKQFKSRIDTIHVGPETDHEARSFLSRLAQASGGKSVNADRAYELASAATYLLTN